MGVFEDLMSVNVNGHIEKKKSGSKKNEVTGQWEDSYLSYLSWTYAWAETKKRYPDASYSIWKNEKGLPYTFDENTGYMVFTTVTIDGISHDMWLPVMDGANNSMKSAPYSFETKNGKKVNVAAATMFDINKTVMRCLVKNLAMFGLGLYIYAGEDLPEGMEKEEPKAELKEEPKAEQKEEPKKSNGKKSDPAVEEANLRLRVIKFCNEHFSAEDIKSICQRFGVETLNALDGIKCKQYIDYVIKNGGEI